MAFKKIKLKPRKKIQLKTRGLTKLEKQQTKTIAKKEVSKAIESKYFETNPEIFEQVAVPAWRNNNVNSEVGVYGYTTGLQNNSNTSIPNQTNSYRYGANSVNGDAIPMTSLDLNRVFTDANTIPQRASYSVEGSSLRPSYNECQWLIDRKQGVVTSDKEKGLPYKVRMIRVVPRALKGSAQQIDPRFDLFLDQYNEPFGIRSTNSAGQNVFGSYAFHMAKTNSRRYRVIADKTVTLLPTGAVTDLNTNVVNLNDVNNGFRKIKTKHNIGKELFFQSPNVVVSPTDANNQYPDTGFTPEFVLFHVIALGNPETNQDDRGTADLIKISARPISTFKDA